MARALLRGEHGVRADLVRDCLSELERLDRRIAALTKALTAKVIASGTRLTELHGIGFVLAAKILGDTGDPRRLRSKGAFAMLTGTAPSRLLRARPSATVSTAAATASSTTAST
jgi:transposase